MEKLKHLRDLKTDIFGVLACNLSAAFKYQGLKITSSTKSVYCFFFFLFNVSGPLTRFQAKRILGSQFSKLNSFYSKKV